MPQNYKKYKRGRPEGTSVYYTPQQTERYRSQYMRYQRAVEKLKGNDMILFEESPLRARFRSKRSPVGYWEVSGSELPLTAECALINGSYSYQTLDSTFQIESSSYAIPGSIPLADGEKYTENYNYVGGLSEIIHTTNGTHTDPGDNAAVLVGPSLNFTLGNEEENLVEITKDCNLEFNWNATFELMTPTDTEGEGLVIFQIRNGDFIIISKGSIVLLSETNPVVNINFSDTAFLSAGSYNIQSIQRIRINPDFVGPTPTPRIISINASMAVTGLIGQGGITCNCPDKTKQVAANPQSPYPSEQNDRDWTASAAGTPDKCWHEWAVKILTNPDIEVPTDLPQLR